MGYPKEFPLELCDIARSLLVEGREAIYAAERQHAAAVEEAERQRVADISEGWKETIAAIKAAIPEPLHGYILQPAVKRVLRNEHGDESVYPVPISIPGAATIYAWLYQGVVYFVPGNPATYYDPDADNNPYVYTDTPGVLGRSYYDFMGAPTPFAVAFTQVWDLGKKAAALRDEVKERNRSHRQRKEEEAWEGTKTTPAPEKREKRVNAYANLQGLAASRDELIAAVANGLLAIVEQMTDGA